MTIQSLSHNFPTDRIELFNLIMHCALHTAFGRKINGGRPFFIDFTFLLSGIPTKVDLKGLSLESDILVLFI